MEDKNEMIYNALHRVLVNLQYQYPEFIYPAILADKIFEKQKKNIYDDDGWEWFTNIKDADEIIQYLDQKGYIEKNLNKVRLSLEGIIFLNKGGFKWQYNLDKMDFRQTYEERKVELSKNKIVSRAAWVGWILFFFKLGFDYYMHN